ncbi:GNAT family N-acetyltransferase [uncultured Cellulomonas sp.]|uniref:GNAT family N-acetyltransferase n=1 Tax=uncultured Cellulomonas sp. TaxID=189682 RepID=UPI00261F4955|nr:GNAT family N-acetyltransferase [uncultured Cellulomonas sp.]
MTDTSTQPSPAPTLRPIAERAQPPATLSEPPQALGLRWRPLERADAGELHGLVAAIEDADQPPTRTDVDEVAEKFDGDWKDMARDSLAGWDADGVLRAYGTAEVRPGDSRTVRAFLDGGVHPQWRGRGIGRALFAWQLGRGRQKLAESGKELPARLAAYAEEDAAGTRRLLAAAGLEPRRYYRTMRRDLAGELPVVELDAGLRVVPWSPELDEAVRFAHNDAFRDHWGSEPATAESWSTGRSKFAPEWSFLVLDEAAEPVDGAPVVAAYAMTGRYEQDWAVAGYTSGYTEILGVRRAYRGRRLAPALLAASMAAFRADGIQYAELDVDTENPSGAHGLYERLGYEVRHGSVMYSIEL